MHNQTFINISKIIERDKKTSTYKFALLRGTIDIIQDNSPYILVKEHTVEIPLGLLIEKWLIYYYPFFEAGVKIPQIVGKNTNIKFQNLLVPIINYYKQQNGLSGFYNDLRIKGISKEINSEFYALVRELKYNIVKNPMQYIGNSINKGLYTIYQYQNNATLTNTAIQNTNWLINSCGTFTIPRDYYDVFQMLGSFISGTDNILFKWAQFSVKASNQTVNPETVIGEILKSPITEREVTSTKNLCQSVLQKEGAIICVWSGKQIIQYEVDHVIPFSIWKNNDLWNLLPAEPTVNKNKLDKIPSASLMQRQKDLIIHYWELIFAEEKERFENEIRVTLLGNHPFNNWQNKAFEQLLTSSKYLIETRGYEEWNI